MSYMVSCGLIPYFTEINIREIVQGPSYFTLHFDETVSAQTKRQMDLLVCYWSVTNSEVKVKYLKSAMYGHAKVVNVGKEMLTALEELGIPLRLMLSLGMDGSNVDTSILNKLNKIKKEKGFPELVSFLRHCLIHVCNNSFRKGVLMYGFRAKELCMNLFYFFSKTSCRQADLFQIEQPLGLE